VKRQSYLFVSKDCWDWWVNIGIESKQGAPSGGWKVVPLRWKRNRRFPHGKAEWGSLLWLKT